MTNKHIPDDLIQDDELEKIVSESIHRLLSGYNTKHGVSLAGILTDEMTRRPPSVVHDKGRTINDILEAEDVNVKKEKRVASVSVEEPVKPTTKESSKITSDNAMKLLNDIRSGKSVKDPLIKKEFISYFSNLKIPARTAFIGFLEGIKDIMVAGEPAATADDPSDDITMEPISKAKTSQETPESESPEMTPPIKIGEPQTEAAKKYAKQLMIS